LKRLVYAFWMVMYYSNNLPFTLKKIVLEPLREMDAKFLFLESLKYFTCPIGRKPMKRPIIEY
jgi:hypothetical protein